MNLKRLFKNKSADSFMEYVLILGVISAVFIGMNTYVKRGIQGRIKDLTDSFISNEQVDKVIADSNTTSQSDTIANSTQDNYLFAGGGAMKVTSVQKRDVFSLSNTTEVRNPLYIPTAVPSDQGIVVVPQKGTVAQAAILPAVQAQNVNYDSDSLSKEKASLLQQAGELDEQATQKQISRDDLYYQAVNMGGCPDKDDDEYAYNQWVSSRNTMFSDVTTMDEYIASLRAQSADLRGQAQEMATYIAKLDKEKQLYSDAGELDKQNNALAAQAKRDEAAALQNEVNIYARDRLLKKAGDIETQARDELANKSITLDQEKQLLDTADGLRKAALDKQSQIDEYNKNHPGGGK